MCKMTKTDRKAQDILDRFNQLPIPKDKLKMLNTILRDILEIGTNDLETHHSCPTPSEINPFHETAHYCATIKFERDADCWSAVIYDNQFPAEPLVMTVGTEHSKTAIHRWANLTLANYRVDLPEVNDSLDRSFRIN